MATLQELRTLLRESILNDRTDRVEGSSDYLWTDNTLNLFINEAQRRFAVRSLILHDNALSSITQVELVAGQTEYALDPLVFAVISAKNAAQEVDLTRVGHTVLACYRAPTEQWIDPTYFTSIPPGATVAYTTDEGVAADALGSMARVTLRVFPTPTAQQAGQVIRLRVVRKPVKLAAEDDVPEIPEDHHIEMLDWAAYLALRIVDDDAGAAKRAVEFSGTFEAHVVGARTLVMRKLFAPMGWGFGRGGFSWDN